MKKKVITKLCVSPRTHATTKQGKEKKNNAIQVGMARKSTIKN